MYMQIDEVCDVRCKTEIIQSTIFSVCVNYFFLSMKSIQNTFIITPHLLSSIFTQINVKKNINDVEFNFHHTNKDF